MTLPTWCTTASSNELEAMAAQEYPAIEVPLLTQRGVYWFDLIAAAKRREKEMVAKRQAEKAS